MIKFEMACKWQGTLLECFQKKAIIWQRMWLGSSNSLSSPYQVAFVGVEMERFVCSASSMWKKGSGTNMHSDNFAKHSELHDYYHLNQFLKSARDMISGRVRRREIEKSERKCNIFWKRRMLFRKSRSLKWHRSTVCSHQLSPVSPFM